MSKKSERSEKIVTGEFIVSWPRVFVPQKNEAGNDKYSLNMLFEKNSETIKTLSALAVDVAKAKWGNKVKLVAKWDEEEADDTWVVHPFRDGDKKARRKPDLYGTYKGKIALSASCTNVPPGIADSYKDPATGKIKIIDNPNDFYAGCIARATINLYTSDHKGIKRVCVGLHNLQKLKDGDRLAGGKTNVEDDFDAVEDLSVCAEETEDILGECDDAISFEM